MNNERRAYTREPRRERVIVNVINSGLPKQALEFECNSRDFSAKGVRLHGHTPLDLNSNLALIIHLQTEQQKFSLTGTVRWVTETTENEHLAGVELSEEVETDISKWQQLFN